MGYVAVQGGKQAIDQANRLNLWQNLQSSDVIAVETIKVSMKALVDQVMSEASLYDQTLAALAIKQAGGSMEEAVFLLRAHRSTLPRLYYSQVIEPEQMRVKRRISASFKDIPGGQILGNSKDYQQRFLDFDLLQETSQSRQDALNHISQELKENVKALNQTHSKIDKLPKVVDYLIEKGLVEEVTENNQAPDDITKRSIRYPSTRSQRLQSLQRGQTGAVTALGYAKIRQFSVHPNIGELRVGDLPVRVPSQELGGTVDPEEDYYLGSVEVTEVESLFVSDKAKDAGKAQQLLVLGYGLCYGQNETKAIAMSILDYSLQYPIDHPTSDDEFVLYHIDSVESTGFISHLKLPHYVTFQSELEAMRRMDNEEEQSEEERHV